jgi:hypothetical protein
LSIDEYVVAIDTDLRRPRLHQFFGYPTTLGLHDYLGHSLVSQTQCPQSFRKGEDYVKIMGGKNILFPCLQPSLLVQALALGAVPVPTRVIGDPQAATMVALIHMPSKLRSATDLDGPHGTQVPYRHLMGLTVSRSIGPEDVGHLKRTLHSRPAS